MLLASDIAASQNSGLRPAAQSAINGMASTRAATVVVATFASYPASTTSVILSATFPAGTFVSGSQIRFFLYGSINNASGTPKSFSPSVLVTQAAAQQSAAFLYTAPNGTSEWIIDGAVTFSVPGPALAGLDTNVKESGYSAYSASLGVGSLIRLANRTGTTTVAQDFAVVADPNTLLIDNLNPVGIAVRVNTGASETFTVLGGWMEAM
jgi:hypothetical protein